MGENEISKNVTDIQTLHHYIYIIIIITTIIIIIIISRSSIVIVVTLLLHKDQSPCLLAQPPKCQNTNVQTGKTKERVDSTIRSTYLINIKI